MVIKHVNTQIMDDATGSIILMRFADNPTTEEAKVSVELKVPFPAVSLPEQGDYFQPGTFSHTRFQITALRDVRDALAAEIERTFKSRRSLDLQNL